MHAISRHRPHARRRIARTAAATLALAMLSSLSLAGSAFASRGQTMTFDASNELLQSPSAHRQEVIRDMAELGVDTMRLVIPWRFLAPSFTSSTKPAFDATNPAAYDPSAWAGVDETIALAQTVGLKVLLTPSAPIPNWASASGNSDLANPKPAEFQQFVTAVGRRYNGNFSPGPGFPTLPRVRFWSIYNEPNLEIFLLPQRGNPSAGRIYRDLFLAGQAGLAASGHGGDPLLLGETSPGPGRSGTDPIAFLRQVFCLNRKFKRVGGCAPIRAAGWAQHPYDPFDPPFDRSPRSGLLMMGTIGRLTDALKRAARAGATRGRLPVYVTEYGTESKPDPIGVSLRQQAEFNAIAEYLAWRNPQIKAFNQYLMRDDSGGTFSFQTGLRRAGGAKKPAFDALRMPLVAKRTSRRGRRVLIWGLVRPGNRRYRVTIRFKGGGAGTLRRRTDGRGYFRFTVPFRRGRQYRSTATIPRIGTVSGSWVRPYSFR